MIAFTALCVILFFISVAEHLLFYRPTMVLPPIWRNVSRYAAGVVGTLAILAVLIYFFPAMSLWEMFGTLIILFTMSMLGVIAGYLIRDD